MRHWTRRDFARTLAAAGLFTPFLGLLEPSRARAAAGRAKYLLVFFTNGTDVPAWSPKGSSESGITFAAGSMIEPLSPLKQNLIIVEKLNSNGTASSHGAPGGLTGMGYGNPIHISVEQFVSDALRAAGIQTQIPNLLLGGIPTEQQTTFFRAGKALSPIASPTAAFQAIFSGAKTDTSSSSSTPAAPSDADQRRARRKRILDLVRAEIGALKQTLGDQERQKLDVHLDSIQQLDDRMAQQVSTAPPSGGVVAVDCKAPASPANGSEPLLNSVLHLDLAINAFACDITRVAAVQFGHHQNTQVSLSDVSQPGDWHNGFLHSDNPRTRLAQLERWLCKQFVAAADKLKSLPAPDGSGTLFDQTLMVWARDMGDAVVHDGSDMRFLFSGGAGGYLKFSPNGRYLSGNGEFHLRALLNVCEAMGVVNFTGFGDPAATGAARTPLSGIANT